MKKILRLTEGDLHRIIKNSVKRIIRESDEYYDTSSDDFYSDEDNYGNQGEEGMVKSYVSGFPSHSVFGKIALIKLALFLNVTV